MFVVVLAIFAGLNYFLWETVTEDLLSNRKYAGGDLARMGYVSGSKQRRVTTVDLPLRHVEMKEYNGQQVDLLTIGDSFSNGAAGGRNSYYQDYLASKRNLRVLNFEPYRGIDFITTVAIFNNNGLLDKLRPRYILIEASERAFADFAKPLDFNRTLSSEQLKEYAVIDHHQPWPPLGIINNGNLKYLLYTMLYPFSDHAVIGGVYMRKLDRHMFTVNNGNVLLFLKYKNIATPDNISMMNDNLNTLSDKLAARGIRLIFMPAVDKYNLYCDYLADNPYPKSTFFEVLRRLPRRYVMIDTKAILAEELKKGEKDVFYADDTHWSWKASQKIFETVRIE
jgi:hypothetical protein